MFVNIVLKICFIIEIIQTSIILLSYAANSSTKIWFYNLAMSNWDKKQIFKVFKTFGNENIEYIIFVAINTYEIGTDNPNI